ncbi:MAG: nucleotidyltransferase domain-containing protein [Actinomycetota bacterium]
MEHLYERLATHVREWRANGYPTPNDEFPAIAEILEWARGTEEEGLRFLRLPQVAALETYWYLRLLERTPHVFELYRRFYPPEEDRRALLEALGVSDAAFAEANYELDRLWKLAEDDDGFVKKHQLHALRESLTLSYPSYILALAMGAGKTILIGAVVATEFAMALEYPLADFVENALVFAPGKTIIESLRELTEVPYGRILPDRFHKRFAASLKLTFTRDGEKDVPVVPGSSFNVVVTNTEKIRIQKEQIRKSDIGRLFDPRKLEEARAEVANARLTKIASLPHLAVFSDEAHHTYGQSLEKGLKRVRQTVDYLVENTNVVCVVNTTGTPYFKRQPLKDVVVWYGLSQGIRDGILKDVSGNIQGYDFSGDAAAYVDHVIRDFFADYRDVALPNGAPAKIALYFPQTDDLGELRSVVDSALIESRLEPSVCLVNTSNAALTKPADVDAFNRLNDPASPHRVVLLVNKGTEGWNCPSLFACALVRKLKSSNNFVLQAASRCLRQVPGNAKLARIYLSTDNYNILDRQLSETYGESIQQLNQRPTERRTARLVLRKRDIPPLVVKQIVRTVVRKPAQDGRLQLEMEPAAAPPTLAKRTYTLATQHVGRRVLRQIEDTELLRYMPETVDVYEASVQLSALYRVDVWQVLDELRRLYTDDVPVAHLDGLARQIEDQTGHYDVLEEEVERALALVKPEGFTPSLDADGAEIYTAEIMYSKDRERLLLSLAEAMGHKTEFGFHYDPYNFDSQPEKHYFESMLGEIDLHPEEVEDIYFTGGITDSAKTDFFVEYRDDQGKWRRYTPDFVIRKKAPPGRAAGSGKVLIVEIKSPLDPVKTEMKAMAVKGWEELNPERIKYELIVTKSEIVPADLLEASRVFVRESVGDGLAIDVDRATIEEFCKKWNITEFSFFGSVLRDDFGDDSDVDVLVTFSDDVTWSLFDLIHAEEELEGIFSRSVDLVERKGVEESENWIRRKRILESAESYLVSQG